MSTAYCFDLDGTVTRREVLPIIAAEVGLAEEIGLLTEMTIRGQIPFEMSFRLRCRLLAEIPVATVARIVAAVPVDNFIVRFIQSRPEECFIVTGNLDVWVAQLVASFGCGLYSSRASIRADGKLGPLTSVLRKSAALHDLRSRFHRLVSIGEGYNDLPMFEEADVGVAYGGVHPPAREVIDIADYAVIGSQPLCRLLNTL